MSRITDLHVELKNQQNETIYGSLTIEGVPQLEMQAGNVSATERDPKGASAFVVTVVLVYAIAIVFLIASHVFVKKKEDSLDYQIRLVEKYWEESSYLRERGAKESFKKLKHSIVPAVAKSKARDLISRRKSFAPILANAGIIMDENGEDSSPEAEKVCQMPSIQEESDEETYAILPSITVTNVDEIKGQNDKVTLQPSRQLNGPGVAVKLAEESDMPRKSSMNGKNGNQKRPSIQKVSFSATPELINDDVNDHDHQLSGDEQQETYTYSKTIKFATSVSSGFNPYRIPPAPSRPALRKPSDRSNKEQETCLGSHNTHVTSVAADNMAFEKSPQNERRSSNIDVNGSENFLHPNVAVKQGYDFEGVNPEEIVLTVRGRSESPLLHVTL